MAYTMAQASGLGLPVSGASDFVAAQKAVTQVSSLPNVTAAQGKIWAQVPVQAAAKVVPQVIANTVPPAVSIPVVTKSTEAMAKYTVPIEKRAHVMPVPYIPPRIQPIKQPVQPPIKIIQPIQPPKIQPPEFRLQPKKPDARIQPQPYLPIKQLTPVLSAPYIVPDTTGRGIGILRGNQKVNSLSENYTVMRKALGLDR